MMGSTYRNWPIEASRLIARSCTRTRATPARRSGRHTSTELCKSLLPSGAHSLTAPVRRAFTTSHSLRDASSTPSATPGIPYSSLIVGIPPETYPSERRIAVSPSGVSALLKKGFKSVLIPPGAGVASSFPDEEYVKAGATLTPDVYSSDILLKVRPPTESEVAMMKDGQTLISFIYPGLNKPLVERLRERGLTSFGMDAIPRISRAQVFDALSSMANTAGEWGASHIGSELSSLPSKSSTP